MSGTTRQRRRRRGTHSLRATNRLPSPAVSATRVSPRRDDNPCTLFPSELEEEEEEEEEQDDEDDTEVGSRLGGGASSRSSGSSGSSSSEEEEDNSRPRPPGGARPSPRPRRRHPGLPAKASRALPSIAAAVAAASGGVGVVFFGRKQRPAVGGVAHETGSSSQSSVSSDSLSAGSRGVSSSCSSSSSGSDSDEEQQEQQHQQSRHPLSFRPVAAKRTITTTTPDEDTMRVKPRPPPTPTSPTSPSRSRRRKCSSLSPPTRLSKTQASPPISPEEHGKRRRRKRSRHSHPASLFSDDNDDTHQDQHHEDDEEGYNQKAEMAARRLMQINAARRRPPVARKSASGFHHARGKKTTTNTTKRRGLALSSHLGMPLPIVTARKSAGVGLASPLHWPSGPQDEDEEDGSETEDKCQNEDENKSQDKKNLNEENQQKEDDVTTPKRHNHTRTRRRRSSTASQDDSLEKPRSSSRSIVPPAKRSLVIEPLENAAAPPKQDKHAPEPNKEDQPSKTRDGSDKEQEQEEQILTTNSVHPNTTTTPLPPHLDSDDHSTDSTLRKCVSAVSTLFHPGQADVVVEASALTNGATRLRRVVEHALVDVRRKRRVSRESMLRSSLDIGRDRVMQEYALLRKKQQLQWKGLKRRVFQEPLPGNEEAKIIPPYFLHDGSGGEGGLLEGEEEDGMAKALWRVSQRDVQPQVSVLIRVPQHAVAGQNQGNGGQMAGSLTEATSTVAAASNSNVGPTPSQTTTSSSASASMCKRSETVEPILLGGAWDHSSFSKIPTPICTTAHLMVPPSSATIFLRGLVSSEDQANLSYVPYFGDDDKDDVVSDLYDTQARERRIVAGSAYHDDERSRMVGEVVDELLRLRPARSTKDGKNTDASVMAASATTTPTSSVPPSENDEDDTTDADATTSTTAAEEGNSCMEEEDSDVSLSRRTTQERRTLPLQALQEGKETAFEEKKAAPPQQKPKRKRRRRGKRRNSSSSTALSKEEGEEQECHDDDDDENCRGSDDKLRLAIKDEEAAARVAAVLRPLSLALHAALVRKREKKRNRRRFLRKMQRRRLRKELKKKASNGDSLAGNHVVDVDMQENREQNVDDSDGDSSSSSSSFSSSASSLSSTESQKLEVSTFWYQRAHEYVRAVQGIVAEVTEMEVERVRKIWNERTAVMEANALEGKEEVHALPVALPRLNGEKDSAELTGSEMNGSKTTKKNTALKSGQLDEPSPSTATTATSSSSDEYYSYSSSSASYRTAVMHLSEGEKSPPSCQAETGASKLEVEAAAEGRSTVSSVRVEEPQNRRPRAISKGKNGVITGSHQTAHKDKHSVQDKSNKNKALPPSTNAPPDASKAEEPAVVKNSSATRPIPYMDLMDSYRNLFCRRCFTYDCNMHGNIPKPDVALQAELAAALEAEGHWMIAAAEEAKEKEGPKADVQEGQVFSATTAREKEETKGKKENEADEKEKPGHKNSSNNKAAHAKSGTNGSHNDIGEKSQTRGSSSRSVSDKESPEKTEKNAPQPQTPLRRSGRHRARVITCVPILSASDAASLTTKSFTDGKMKREAASSSSSHLKSVSPGAAGTSSLTKPDKCPLKKEEEAKAYQTSCVSTTRKLLPEKVATIGTAPAEKLTPLQMSLCERTFLIFRGDVTKMAKAMGTNANAVAQYCKERELKLKPPAYVIPQRERKRKIVALDVDQGSTTEQGGSGKKKLSCVGSQGESINGKGGTATATATAGCRPKDFSMRQYNVAWLKRLEGAEIQPWFVPCDHTGPCSEQTCSCVQNAVFCTKHCAWGTRSRNFFRGCACKAGMCRTKSCSCFAARRECDPDLCRACGAGTDEPNQPAVKQRCRNDNIGMRRHCHLLLAKSGIEDAGWGIYTKNALKKGDFVHEYVGEVISQEEAERRGRIYDKVNRSYLFNLTSDFVVDASRKGNKTKFANHSSKPNCYTKLISVNGTMRIGLFAQENIEPQSELFFDYRYDVGMDNDLIHKPGITVDWMKNPKMANQISKKKHA